MFATYYWVKLLTCASVGYLIGSSAPVFKYYFMGLILRLPIYMNMDFLVFAYITSR